MRWFSLSLVFVAGCYLDHGRTGEIHDAGLEAADALVPPPPDAGLVDALFPPQPAPDAGPARGGAWRLVATHTIQLIAPRIEWVVGEAPVLLANVYPAHLCEHPGPVVAERTAPRTILVRPLMWRQPGEEGVTPCEGITAQYERTLEAPILDEPGAWAFVDERGTTLLEVEVLDEFVARADYAASGEACAYSFECAGDALCVPADARGERHECGRPCTVSSDASLTSFGLLAPLDVECRLGERCLDLGSDLLPRCLEFGSPGSCEDDAACPVGSYCEERFGLCEWRSGLLALRGGSCVGDHDCAPGLRCTLDDGGSASCEILCVSDHRCPDGGVCTMSPARTRLVCVAP